MGGGSEFPSKLMEAFLNGLAVKAVQEPAQKNWENKQHNLKDRNQGIDIKCKECNKKEKEKKKEKVVKECSKMGREKRQPESAEVVECAEENRRQFQSKDKGDETRTDREEETTKQQEVLVNGWENTRTEELGKFQDMGKVLEEIGVKGDDGKRRKDKQKRIEDHSKVVMKERKELRKSQRETDHINTQGKVEGRTEVRVENKQKEQEKSMKEQIKNAKMDKKELTTPERENVHGKDGLLDKNLTHNDRKDGRKDKVRYNAEKLKNKLAKLDAKMEKIAAKSEILLQRLKEAGECSKVDNDQESDVASILKTNLPEVPTEVTPNELHDNISERILYPKLENKDMTGAGY